MVIQSLPFTSESASDRGVFATPPKPGAGGGGGSGEVLVYCWRAHAATCVVCVLAIAIYKSQEEVNTTESSLQYCTVNLRRKNRKLIEGAGLLFTGYHVVDWVVCSQLFTL